MTLLKFGLDILTQQSIRTTSSEKTWSCLSNTEKHSAQIFRYDWGWRGRKRTPFSWPCRSPDPEHLEKCQILAGFQVCSTLKTLMCLSDRALSFLKAGLALPSSVSPWQRHVLATFLHQLADPSTNCDWIVSAHSSFPQVA